MTEPQRPLLRSFEKLLLFAGIVLFVLVFIQHKTGKVVQTVETEVFTKGLASRATPPPPGVVSDPLPSIATIFAKKQHQDEPDFWAGLQIPDAEKDFFKALRNIYKNDAVAQKKSPMDWLSTLQAARLTYQKVGQIFGEARPEGALPIPEKTISMVLSDSLGSERVFEKIEQLFKIPREDARGFARRGHDTMTDWALFVEKKQE